MDDRVDRWVVAQRSVFGTTTTRNNNGQLSVTIQSSRHFGWFIRRERETHTAALYNQDRDREITWSVVVLFWILSEKKMTNCIGSSCKIRSFLNRTSRVAIAQVITDRYVCLTLKLDRDRQLPAGNNNVDELESYFDCLKLNKSCSSKTCRTDGHLVCSSSSRIEKQWHYHRIRRTKHQRSRIVGSTRHCRPQFDTLRRDIVEITA